MKLRCRPPDSLTLDLEQKCHHLPLTNKTTSQAAAVELPEALTGLVSLFETFLFCSSLLCFCF